MARVDELLAAARGGRSGALLVSGEPGIGKTALLAYARAMATGMRVLEAVGSEAERHLAFAGLADLLGPVLGRVDRIPGPQADALRGALALGPPSPGDRFTTYAAVLSLLAAAAEDGPLLCIVDDAHWLDAGSLEAVAFAGRRLRAEGVVLLVGAREGVDPLIDDSPLPRLRLVALAPGPAEHLLEDRAGRALPAEVRQALVRGAAGNPLALIELADVLSADQLEGREPLPDPLPVGPHLTRALLQPVAALPEATRRALLVASADDGAARFLVPALGAQGLGMADLEPAERADIVATGPVRVSFSHPLVRAAVYHAAAGPDRRAAHAAHAVAAASVGKTDALDRRAWHLALASAGPDESVAAELEDAARRAAGRNAYWAAGEALEAAARLSPRTADRARRLTEAGRNALAAGAFPRAAALLDQVVALPVEPALQMEARVIRGYVEMFGGSARRAVDMLVTSAEAMEASMPFVAASLLAQATMPAQLRGDAQATQALARRAEVLAEGAPPDVRSIVDAAVAAAENYRGRPVVLAPETEGELARQAAAGDPMAYFWAIAVLQFHMLEERYDLALERLDAFTGAARMRSTPSALPFPLCFRAEVLFRLGRLQEAHADASEAAQIADETRQALMCSYAYGTLARVDAVLGRADDCRAHARRAIADVAVNEADILTGYSEAALGLLALGEGRLSDALDHLVAIDRRIAGLGSPHPQIIPFAQDLIETRIRLGRTDEATEDLERLARRAETAGGSWPKAAVARCRGLLAGDDAFEAQFTAALALHERTPTPFERGRTLLCLGERRRRARRMRDARGPLMEALALFESIGAAPWAAWARRELRAAGGRPAEPRPEPVDGLTPQELRVALAVSGGATNKEAAAALLISPKTVEYHLARIFGKLGVRSRTELAARLAREPPKSSHPRPPARETPGGAGRDRR